MIDDVKALEIAEGYLQKLNQTASRKFALVDHKCSRIDGGWRFSYNSQEYVDGKGDPLMGYLKFAVSDDGIICKTGDGSELGSFLNKESKTPFF